MVPINPSPRTPLYDLVSEALGPKDSIHSGQLLLIFGGYNTIGEEFGANSTFVSPMPRSGGTEASATEPPHSPMLVDCVRQNNECEKARLYRCCGLLLTGLGMSGERLQHRGHLLPLDSTTAATALTVSSLKASLVTSVWPRCCCLTLFVPQDMQERSGSSGSLKQGRSKCLASMEGSSGWDYYLWRIHCQPGGFCRRAQGNHLWWRGLHAG